jgi:hypothetical protein
MFSMAVAGLANSLIAVVGLAGQQSRGPRDPYPEWRNHGPTCLGYDSVLANRT